jgi:hypothetical protein
MKTKYALLSTVLTIALTLPMFGQDTHDDKTKTDMKKHDMSIMGKQMGQDSQKKGGASKKPSTGTSDQTKEMGGMQGMEGMEMRGMNMEGEMSGMSGMDMMGKMSMPKMAKKKGMGGMKMSSALPGFPGSSHLYHIGSTGFFLDHPTHITLTSDQQMTLNRIKEKAMLNQSDADRKIEEAEQQMWQLTAADSPDADKIETKTREIEKMRADKRLAFIHAVGEASNVLTHDQHQALMGTMAAGKK